jgi:hypothetical protein
MELYGKNIHYTQTYQTGQNITVHTSYLQHTNNLKPNRDDPRSEALRSAPSSEASEDPTVYCDKKKRWSTCQRKEHVVKYFCLVQNGGKETWC